MEIRFYEALIGIWFFFFGASLGSFLNVVVYRTPRGFSLLGSSFCPKCRHAIRWRDNVPVFGWFFLGGRCRDCHARISARYPLVELITGLMVLGLAVVELFLDGANLPGRSSGGYPGLPWLVQQFPRELAATLLAHVVLLCFLLSWALIRWDGYRLPRSSLILAFVVAVGLPAITPMIHPVSLAALRPDWPDEFAWLERFDTALLGMLVGAVLGGMQSMAPRVWRSGWLSRSGSEPASEAEVLDLAACVALIGGYLGWQAAVSVFLLAAIIRVLVSSVTGGILCRHGSSVWLSFVPATFLHIVGWRGLDNLSGWPGSQAPLTSVVFAVIVAMYFSVVASYVESSRAAQ